MRVGITIAIAIVVLLGAAVAMYLPVVRTEGQATRDLSKMMHVRNITVEALSAHYKQHGSFPRSLSELPLETLPWGDEGSSARDLDSWHYTSDGQSFTMTWKWGTQAQREALRGHSVPELFVEGRDGQLSYSKDERDHALQR